MDKPPLPEDNDSGILEELMRNVDLLISSCENDDESDENNIAMKNMEALINSDNNSNESTENTIYLDNTNSGDNDSNNVTKENEITNNFNMFRKRQTEGFTEKHLSSFDTQSLFDVEDELHLFLGETTKNTLTEDAQNNNESYENRSDTDVSNSNSGDNDSNNVTKENEITNNFNMFWKRQTEEFAEKHLSSFDNQSLSDVEDELQMFLGETTKNTLTEDAQNNNESYENRSDTDVSNINSGNNDSNNVTKENEILDEVTNNCNMLRKRQTEGFAENHFSSFDTHCLSDVEDELRMFLGETTRNTLTEDAQNNNESYENRSDTDVSKGIFLKAKRLKLSYRSPNHYSSMSPDLDRIKQDIISSRFHMTEDPKLDNIMNFTVSLHTKDVRNVYYPKSATDLNFKHTPKDRRVNQNCIGSKMTEFDNDIEVTIGATSDKDCLPQQDVEDFKVRDTWNVFNSPDRVVNYTNTKTKLQKSTEEQADVLGKNEETSTIKTSPKTKLLPLTSTPFFKKKDKLKITSLANMIAQTSIISPIRSHSSFPSQVNADSSSSTDYVATSPGLNSSTFEKTGEEVIVNNSDDLNKIISTKSKQLSDDNQKVMEMEVQINGRQITTVEDNIDVESKECLQDEIDQNNLNSPDYMIIDEVCHSPSKKQEQQPNAADVTDVRVTDMSISIVDAIDDHNNQHISDENELNTVTKPYIIPSSEIQSNLELALTKTVDSTAELKTNSAIETEFKIMNDSNKQVDENEARSVESRNNNAVEAMCEVEAIPPSKTEEKKLITAIVIDSGESKLRTASVNTQSRGKKRQLSDTSNDHTPLEKKSKLSTSDISPDEVNDNTDLRWNLDAIRTPIDGFNYVHNEWSSNPLPRPHCDLSMRWVEQQDDQVQVWKNDEMEGHESVDEKENYSVHEIYRQHENAIKYEIRRLRKDMNSHRRCHRGFNTVNAKKSHLRQLNKELQMVQAVNSDISDFYDLCDHGLMTQRQRDDALLQQEILTNIQHFYSQ